MAVQWIEFLLSIAYKTYFSTNYIAWWNLETGGRITPRRKPAAPWASFSFKGSLAFETMHLSLICNLGQSPRKLVYPS